MGLVSWVGFFQNNILQRAFYDGDLYPEKDLRGYGTLLQSTH